MSNVSHQYKRIALLCILVFAGMFLFRFLYGFWYPGRVYEQAENSFLSGMERSRKNYASEKMKADVPVNAAPAAANQKYEKVANIWSRSGNFSADEKLVHSTIAKYNAIVQYQQESGKKGGRQLQLLIGVAPEKFDSFYVAAQAIGVIRSTEITKTDKTNEYRKLNAQRVSLEKNLESLNSLQAKDGKIEDLILLHEKIYGVETQLQELGVELGNFDTENEFCTVQFSMYEGAVEKGVSMFTRVKIALQWTVKYYAVLAAAVLMAAIAAWVALKVIALLQAAGGNRKDV